MFLTGLESLAEFVYVHIWKTSEFLTPCLALVIPISLIGVSTLVMIIGGLLRLRNMWCGILVGIVIFLKWLFSWQGYNNHDIFYETLKSTNDNAFQSVSSITTVTGTLILCGIIGLFIGLGIQRLLSNGLRNYVIMMSTMAGTATLLLLLFFPIAYSEMKMEELRADSIYNLLNSRKDPQNLPAIPEYNTPIRK
jgi:hypothetical protein